MAIEAAITFIDRLKREDTSKDKSAIQRAYVERFQPRRMRSVYVGDGYALRFSKAGVAGFSNTVLSLSALQNHDARPFVVVVVREQNANCLLANATFLKKISHSSLRLRSDHVRGSFNGSDILLEYDGISNRPEHFDELFAIHSAFTWQENVDRLVEATNRIVGRNSRFEPSEAQLTILLDAPERAVATMLSPAFHELERELRQSIAANQQDIVKAAQIDNINLRGNAIERILTGTANRHDLGDLIRDIGGAHLAVDIKTKLLDRASAPKAYNVDKMLAFLAKPHTVFAFLMVVVNTRSGELSARLLPVFERSLLNATVVQHHWAGRASRGVTQLSGHFAEGSATDYEPTVNVVASKAFLRRLLAL